MTLMKYLWQWLNGILNRFIFCVVLIAVSPSDAKNDLPRPPPFGPWIDSRFHFDEAWDECCFFCQENAFALHDFTSNNKLTLTLIIIDWWIDGLYMAVLILLMSEIRHKLGCFKHFVNIKKAFHQFITMSWGSTFVLQRRSLHCVVSGDVVDPWWNQYMSCRAEMSRICDDMCMYKLMSSLLNN